MLKKLLYWIQIKFYLYQYRRRCKKVLREEAEAVNMKQTKPKNEKHNLGG